MYVYGSQVVQVDERVRLVKDSETIDSNDESLVKCLADQYVQVLQKPNYDTLRAQLKQIIEQDKIFSVSVVLIHSYIYNQHEVEIGKLCEELGFTNVSLSHQVMPV